MKEQLVREIAKYVRTYKVWHGDQYGGWMGTTEHADDLAEAIIRRFLPKGKDA